MSSLESWGPIGKLVNTIPHYEAINLFGILVAFAVAVLTHSFKLHDRISDVFGIRRRFDRNCILVPLARRVGCLITKDDEIEIGKQRHKLMRAVFYKYASSRAEKPLVDKHDIEHALNAWSWFWVWVEGIVYFVVGAITAQWFGSTDILRIFAIISVVLLSLAILQRARLCRYARPQIDSIAADESSAAEVKRYFDALHNCAAH